MRLMILFAIGTMLTAIGIVYGGTQDSLHSIQIPEIRVELKQGDGRDRVDVLCGVCHSLDYITMQPKASRAQWTATVNKMIKVMGAPVNEEDSKKIIDYLVVNYGTGT